MDITELLTFTKKSGASDLHLSTGNPPMVRVHGEMRRLKLPPLAKEDIHHLISKFIDGETRKLDIRKRELSFLSNPTNPPNIQLPT